MWVEFHASDFRNNWTVSRKEGTRGRERGVNHFSACSVTSI